MCLKSIGCFRPDVYNGLLVDLGTKSIDRVSLNLDRFISEFLVFTFYIMPITFLFTYHVKFSTKI